MNMPMQTELPKNVQALLQAARARDMARIAGTPAPPTPPVGAAPGITPAATPRFWNRSPGPLSPYFAWLASQGMFKGLNALARGDDDFIKAYAELNMPQGMGYKTDPMSGVSGTLNRALSWLMGISMPETEETGAAVDKKDVSATPPDFEPDAQKLQDDISALAKQISTNTGWAREQIQGIIQLMKGQAPVFRPEDIDFSTIKDIARLAANRVAAKQEALNDATMESLALGQPVNPAVRDEYANAITFMDKVLLNASIMKNGTPEQKQVAAQYFGEFAMDEGMKAAKLIGIQGLANPALAVSNLAQAEANTALAQLQVLGAGARVRDGMTPYQEAQTSRADLQQQVNLLSSALKSLNLTKKERKQYEDAFKTLTDSVLPSQPKAQSGSMTWPVQ